MQKGDPLEAITALVPWESFRAEIEAVVLTPDEAKKSKAGRNSFDAIMMFRMLVLQSLYNLSDVQIEYQVWDRATFTRFVGLGSEDCIPDGTTLWLFRERLSRPACCRSGIPGGSVQKYCPIPRMRGFQPLLQWWACS